MLGGPADEVDHAPVQPVGEDEPVLEEVRDGAVTAADEEPGLQGVVDARAVEPGQVLEEVPVRPSPALFRQADVVLRGEAEGRIPDLLRALSACPGDHQVLDAPAVHPDLALCVTPRFDLLDWSAYASMSLQVSRGCPYRCEFCDVTELFGHRPRLKAPAQVLAELEAIRRLGYRGTVFFVDSTTAVSRAGGTTTRARSGTGPSARAATDRPRRT